MNITKTLELTKEHIELAKRLNVYWAKFPDCPVIDQIRPYGNSDVNADVADVLFPDKSYYEDLADEQIQHVHEFHKQMPDAIMCILQGHNTPGTYYQNHHYWWVSELDSDAEFSN